MSPKTRATIKDVARIAQVSPKSISRVINGEPGVSEETRQRILEAISDLGYVTNTAARQLRGTAKVIGLVTSGFEDYAGQVVRGMSQAAQHFGYNLVLYVQHSEGQNADDYRAFLGNGMISGLLMVVPHDYQMLTELCSADELPYVMLDYQGSTPAETIPTVTVTNRKGVLEAAHYLMALGHRHIGFITGEMEMASARERLQGYQEALGEIGIRYDPTLVANGNWTPELGFTQMRTLMERHPEMTALIASDDLTAFGAMDAVKDSGLRVGEDISIIGFDDIPMAANVHPPLTTIRQPMLQMGHAAVELLIALIEDRAPVDVRREYATELVIRQSTGRAAESDTSSSP